MREIKFRAWDSYLKKMVFEGFHIWGEVTEFDLIKLHCYENPNPDYKHSLQRANDMVFMQYTGLKDKNGKEIYEGDIVQYYNSRQGEYLKHDVSFYKGSFGLDKFVWIDDDKYGLLDNIEVIGNIYENPESPKESE